METAARKLGLRVSNHAVGGSSSSNTLALVLRCKREPADVYLLMTGLNDARLSGCDIPALMLYARAVGRILTRFRLAAPNALILVVEQPHLIDYSGYPPHHLGSDKAVEVYNAVLRREIGARPRARYVRTSGWDPLTMLAPDGVHPNDRGHAYLAARVVAAVRESE